MKNKLWQDACVYQIYPRSFCDSNGDGIGDINGITSKLDYLKDLGVDILWLSPVYKSPLDDMGYDVADYYSIHPDYGTMEDMDHLIQEAKKRDIRIVMDLVVNHTSDEHEWFKKSKDKNSKYHDYYFWRDGKDGGKKAPNNWTSMFVGPAWKYDPEVGQYYLHLYGEKQPDLNWHNPEVLKEVEAILNFWLDKGIYGFRCDVINQIYKESLEDGKGHSASGRGMEHYLMKEGNHQILRKFYDDVFSKRDDYVVIGETYKVDLENGRRFLKDHELDMFFIFEHMDLDKSYVPFVKAKYTPRRFVEVLYKWQQQVDWNANYLENHDQRRSITRYGDEGEYWKQSGKMLAMMNLCLRGTPFIYEGEEIGMIDMPKNFETIDTCQDVCVRRVYDLIRSFKIFPKSYCWKFVNQVNRDHARTPMQWDTSKNAGFSTNDSTWLKVNPSYVKINASDEEEDPDSILAFYRSLIAYRKKSDVLRKGSFMAIPTSGNVFAYRREYQRHEVVILFNFDKKVNTIPDHLKGISGQIVLSNYPENDLASLKPYECRLIELD